MKSHILLLIVGIAMAYILMRTVHTPESMITPGAPIQAHNEVANDCFACHTPFRGAPSDKCIDCHTVDEIGLVTTKGETIARDRKGIRFHQQLLESDCVACHSDHKGVQPFRPIKRFSHKLLDVKLQKQCNSCHDKPDGKLHRRLSDDCGLCHTQNEWEKATFKHKSLEPAVLRQCESCHETPDDKRHRKFNKDCGSCHGYEAWEPASFKHEKLPEAKLAQCESCHDKPRDKRHRKFEGKCDTCHGYDDWEAAEFRHSRLPPAELKQCQSCHEPKDDSLHRSTRLTCGECHSQDEWEPATFEHSKYFRFDRRHRKDCDVCHENNDYSKFTCYGCHEHSPRRIRGEHLEEGIRDFDNCEECHRSANEHEAERIWRQKRRELRGESSSSNYRRSYREYEWGEHEHDDDDDDDDDDD